MENFPSIGGRVVAVWRPLVVALGLVTLLTLSTPARAEEPVDCDSVSVELSDHFASPICYLSRFRSGSAIGRNQRIQGESRDYMIHFQSSRSGAGHTYLHAVDFDWLMDVYGVTADQKALGVETELPGGFRYVSVGGNGLSSCILFLKQDRPIRSGFRAQHFGLACDKGRDGAYAPEDAAALLDMIKDY